MKADRIVIAGCFVILLLITFMQVARAEAAQKPTLQQTANKIERFYEVYFGASIPTRKVLQGDDATMQACGAPAGTYNFTCAGLAYGDKILLNRETVAQIKRFKPGQDNWGLYTLAHEVAHVPGHRGGENEEAATDTFASLVYPEMVNYLTGSYPAFTYQSYPEYNVKLRACAKRKTGQGMQRIKNQRWIMNFWLADDITREEMRRGC